MKQREIKFRVWHPPIKDGKAILPGHMDYELVHQKLVAVKTETRQIPEEFGFEHIQHGLYFINKDLAKYGNRLMQFTGLLDKSGKEIYEGDICEDKDNGDRVLIKYDSHGSRFASWTNENNPTNVSAEKIIDDWEYVVIGNIYENKELLK